MGETMFAAKSVSTLCARVALLLAVTAPGVAWACSPWCDGWQSGIAPPDGTSAPASAFAFPVKWLAGSYSAYGPTPLDGGVTLVRSDGGTIPIEIANDDPAGWFLVHPLESIAEGEALTLGVKDVCWSDVWLRSAFTATAAVPLPKSAGTFDLLEDDAGIATAFTGCGSCTKPVRAGVARFRFTPSAELEPWIRLSSLTLLVNGQQWALHEYGRVSEDAGVIGYPTHPYTEVFTRCDLDPRDPDNGLPPGDYIASLVVHVAGASFDPPPLQAAFSLSCANVDSVPYPPNPCSSGPHPDAGSQISPDAGADGGTGDSTPPPPPPCGCTTGAAGLLALAAALTSRLRRR